MYSATSSCLKQRCAVSQVFTANRDVQCLIYLLELRLPCLKLYLGPGCTVSHLLVGQEMYSALSICWEQRCTVYQLLAWTKAYTF